VIRGDIVRLASPRGARGREQRGARYGVVVQADEFAPLSTVILTPTSRRARPASFRPEIEILGETTRVLVEQIRAVDIEQVGDVLGHLSPEEMWGVDVALSTVLDLARR
jgi:mRNA interferase MazF